MNAHEKMELALRKLPWTTPPQVDERVLADGMQALEQAVTTTGNVRAAPASRRVGTHNPRFRRLLMRSSIGLAASLLIGAIAWLALSPLASTPAYGIEDMPGRLLAIKGLHVKGWFNAAPPGAAETRKPVEFYAQRPGRYWATHYGANTNGEPDWNFSDSQRYMVIDPEQKTCTTGKEIPLAAELKVEESLQILFADQFLGGLNVGYKKTGTQTVNGIAADVYEHILSLGDKARARIVLLLNPATGLPIQATSYQQIPGQPDRIWFSLTDIEPNVSVPANLLSFDPPAGYKVVQHDREPSDIGRDGGVNVNKVKATIRFAFDIDGRAILLCWAHYDGSQSPALEDDLQGPAGRKLKLTPTSSTEGRKYDHYFLRADAADKFHWRWSLVVPTTAGATLDGDEPRLEFKAKPGGTGTMVIQPFRFPRERLADIILRTQRLTLPEGAPADAALTLEQIEARIAELQQTP